MSGARPAPYPSDTRAKGWRFELDYEQVEQSDTWALASPDVRPWLLMMWMTAWKQSPCGSMPADDALIAARIGMQPKVFAKVRDVLMRGWWLADDGRMYHDTVAARVLEMLDYRAKSAKRVADYKLRMREQQAGNALPTQQQHRSNDTGTGTGTGTNKEKEPIGSLRASAEKPRASRKCPESFAVTAELAAWAEAEAPGVPIDLETAKLRDHTFKTAITDWPGTWRNWMRNAHQFAAERPAPRAGPASFAEQAKQRMDALTGRTKPAQTTKHMGAIFDAANLLDH
jgi:hypothetical protein